MTPTEKIDAAIHAVLVSSESSDIVKMREAMRKIMSDSYIQGSNDAAVLCDEKSMKLERQAKYSDRDDAIERRSLAWQFSVMAVEIRKSNAAHEAMKGK